MGTVTVKHEAMTIIFERFEDFMEYDKAKQQECLVAWEDKNVDYDGSIIPKLCRPSTY